MVRATVIKRKISQIEEHIRRIMALPHLSHDAFGKDTVTQDVLLFNLTQVIQDCIDIAAHIVSDEGWGMPGTQSEAFDILCDKDVISRDMAEKLIAMTGFRNRVVHEYEDLNLDIVYDVWQKSLKDVKEFCLAVVERFGL